MKKQAKTIIVAGVLLILLASAGILFSLMSPPAVGNQVASVEVAGSEILDGMTFLSVLGPLGKPADVKDTLVFKDGNFFSTECDKKCNYPARPYFIRHAGDKIEFISETRCPYKDAKIVWRGAVQNERIAGVFTWTISRWYWTVEKDFWFSGKLAEQAIPISGNQ